LLSPPDDGIVECIAFVYILRCHDASLYVGSTDDLVARLERHNRGDGCSFTASRIPVTLVYAEEHQTDDRAQKRERQIKRWTRAKKEALIAGYLLLLKRL
jgi:putative endonuclease